MPNKKYNLIKLLDEYNKKYKRNCLINKDIKEAVISSDSYTVLYTYQSGTALPINSKNNLGDFLYYYISPKPTDPTLKAFIQNKTEEKMSLKIEILPSTKIRYAYLYANYYANTGPLGSSCMRSKENQRALNFYIRNDVKIVVITDDKNKIHARALLWSDIKSVSLRKSFTYLDRVYSRSDNLLLLFSDLAEENNWKTYRKNGKGKEGYYKDNLNITGLCHFPYTDTFRYLYYKDNLVAAESSRIRHKVNYSDHIYLTTTGNGGYFPNLDPDRVEEALTGSYISKKDAIKVTRYNGWVLKKNIADINGDYYSVNDTHIIQTNADGWVLKENSVTEIKTNHIISKDKAVEVTKYKGWIHESNIVNIGEGIYHKQDNEIVCYDNKWYHISECFINYNLKQVNEAMAKTKYEKSTKQSPFFCEDSPEYIQYFTRLWYFCRKDGPEITRKDRPMIPKKYAIIAYNLIYSPILDDIEYQEVYYTDTKGLIKLTTGEFIVDSTENREHLKKFNNKYYIKRDFKLPDKNQLLFDFMRR